MKSRSLEAVQSLQTLSAQPLHGIGNSNQEQFVHIFLYKFCDSYKAKPTIAAVNNEGCMPVHRTQQMTDRYTHTKKRFI